MTVKIVVGVDGEGTGDRALDYAKEMAGFIGDCELLVVYVIEWSPFTFQTPEENAQRHNAQHDHQPPFGEEIGKPHQDNDTDLGLAAWSALHE